MKTIALLEPNPDYDPDRDPIQEDVGRRLKDIFRDLYPHIREDIDESFSLAPLVVRDDRWPARYRWIACYAVTGDSEGHYIHIDVVAQSHSHQLVFLGKTFNGLEHAQKIANKVAALLGA